MAFEPDPSQSGVLAHSHGALLVTGGPGTGKTAALRERLARLIEGDADPERVALVVRSAWARGEARAALLERLGVSLPALKVLTVHGLAYHVVTLRFEALGYRRPPEVLSAPDQFSKVRELLAGEDPARWPAYGSMLGLRGFADQVRQFLLRAQEALMKPDEILAKAEAAGLGGWRELADFYRRYLEVLDDEESVDFAGLVEQAAAAAAKGDPLFDHVLVDDYQDATFATEALLAGLSARSLVVAGDTGAHVFSFQGTTDVPLERFAEQFAAAGHAEVGTNHRATELTGEAWLTSHTSEEHAAAARELRRAHVEDGVPWSDMAVVVRRQGDHLGGLLRALDDASVPRATPEGGLSLLAEPATHPFVLALRWLARPNDRDALVEPILASDLARVPPAVARGLVRRAQSAGGSPAGALAETEGLGPEEIRAVAALRSALAAAEEVAEGSVLDAFSTLWRRLPSSRRLVGEAERSADARRDLDAVLALSHAVAEAGGPGGDVSAASFLDALEAGEAGPGVAGDRSTSADTVQVMTAHGAAGREFDTVIVVGVVEGNFPSLTRPEPMFDLGALARRISQSERNRLRLEDERRLFRLVVGRARRRVVFTASDPHGEETKLSVRSRFVGEIGVRWSAAPVARSSQPLTAAEAAAVWRRSLADAGGDPADRLAALDGLLALGEDPGRWWFQRNWTDTGRPLHESIRVSYSKLERLENCELQFALSEELGLERPAGYHAWVGHLVHRIIEDCERGLIPRTKEGLTQAAEDRWRSQEFPSLAVSEAFRRLVTRTMLPAWFAEYGGGPALERELHFEFDFDGATVSGYIDRIGPAGAGVQITDYKTGKSRNAGPPEENLQLGTYYLAVNWAEELAAYRPVKAVELAFLRDRDREGRMSRKSMVITEDGGPAYERAMTERLSGLIGRLRELQSSEAYRPSPAAVCRFCDFKTLCPLWPEGAPLFPAEVRP